MKTFIALEFDDEIKSRLRSIQEILVAHSIKGKWVDYDNFHITLKYLGETDENKVSCLEEILYNLSQNYNSFKCSLDNLSFFKGKESLRVVWVGLIGDIDSLSKISGVLNEKVYPLGYEIEKRKFKPHITLGRDVIFNLNIEEINVKLAELFNYNFILNKISLMKSEMVKNKRIYKSIIRYDLK